MGQLDSTNAGAHEIYFILLCGFYFIFTLYHFFDKTLATMSRREDVDTFSSLSSMKSSGKDKSEQITQCPLFVLFCAKIYFKQLR